MSNFNYANWITIKLDQIALNFHFAIFRFEFSLITSLVNGARPTRCWVTWAGCPPTTSPRSTRWRSTPGTTGPSRGTRPSTSSPRASTGASWWGSPSPLRDRGASPCGTRAGSTTTGYSLARRTAMWVTNRKPNSLWSTSCVLQMRILPLFPCSQVSGREK